MYMHTYTPQNVPGSVVRGGTPLGMRKPFTSLLFEAVRDNMKI